MNIDDVGSSPNVEGQASMASRTINGAGVSLIGKMLVKVVDVLVLLVVARLLTPESFGLVGLAMTFVVIAEAILDIPLDQALLREKRITKSLLDTVFTLSVLRGILLGALLSLAAYPASLLYEDGRLSALVIALSLAPAFRGSRSPALVHYFKRMDFRWDVLLELSGKLVGGAACILTAWLTESYWALAIGVVATPLTMNLGSYIVAPYRPRFSLSQWSRFSQFTGWMTLSQIARSINWQADKLILGNFLSTSQFGRYSVAKDLANTSQQAIVAPLTRPLLSACSEAHHRSANLADFYLKSCRAILMIVGPVFLSVGVLADQLVLILLGEGWEQSAWVLQWLSFLALLSSFQPPVDCLAITLDRTKELAMRAIVAVAFRFPVVAIACVYFSYTGALVGLATSEVVAFMLFTTLGCRLSRLPIQAFIAKLSKTVLPLAIMFLVLSASRSTFGINSAVWVIVVQVLASIMVSYFAYLVSVWVLWRLNGRPEGLEKLVTLKLVTLFRQSYKQLKSS